MNILIIIFYISKSDAKIQFLIKLILLGIALGSIYIYFLSFSKSAILGLFLSLLLHQ